MSSLSLSSLSSLRTTLRDRWQEAPSRPAQDPRRTPTWVGIGVRALCPVPGTSNVTQAIRRIITVPCSHIPVVIGQPQNGFVPIEGLMLGRDTRAWDVV